MIEALQEIRKRIADTIEAGHRSDLVHALEVLDEYIDKAHDEPKPIKK